MKPEFLNELEGALSAGQTPILSLNTEDRFYYPEAQIPPIYLPYFIARYFNARGYRVAYFIPANGAVELSQKGIATIKDMSEGDIKQVFRSITKLLRMEKEKWLIILSFTEHIQTLENGTLGLEMLHTLARDEEIINGQSRLVLITYEDMPCSFITQSPFFCRIPVGLPSLQERKDFITFIEGLKDKGNLNFSAACEGMDTDELARLTAGMTLVSIESLYKKGVHHNGKITRDAVRVEKSNTIRNLARDLLEVKEPQEGFSNVAGMETVKENLSLLIRQIRAGSCGVPQSILLQGIPGCGKSHIVEAFAHEIGWPLLMLRNVRDMYVGKSEQNLEIIIKLAEQLAPGILSFDEIDQLLGQRGTGASGDSGTSERMLARIFSWLGSMHLRGKLLFIATTNRPDLLDQALLDRFKVSIPVLYPQRLEIEQLIPLLLNRFQRSIVQPFNLDRITDALFSKQITVRALQEILIRAGSRADLRTGNIGASITEQDIYASINDYLPSEDLVEMEYIGLISLRKTSAQSLLPWNSFDGLRQGYDLPLFVKENRLVNSDGTLDVPRLEGRIRELSQLRLRQRLSA